jgi:uncharacterized membrane protein
VRARWLTAGGLALTLAGLAISGYLTYVHYAELDPVCFGGSHGCVQVQSSEYAELGPIPVPVLGVAGYAAIAVALALPGERARLVAAGLALGGFGFSLYLTYLELFVIDAICEWCVVSACLMTALAAITAARVLRS